MEKVLTEPSSPSVEDHQKEQNIEELVPRASLFQDSLFLQPVLTWLNKMLDGVPWWDLSLVQGTIVLSLCHYGLDEWALVWQLQPFLQDQDQMATFVSQLIDIHLRVVQQGDPAADRASELPC